MNAMKSGIISGVMVVGLITAASNANAARSGTVGGGGGNHTYHLKCNPSEYAYGVDAMVSDVILKIRLKCRNASGNYTGSGNPVKWGASVRSTAYSIGNSGGVRSTAICPRDYWIGEIKGQAKKIITGQTVLRRLGLGCYKYREGPVRTGSREVVRTVSKGTGGWTKSWQSCPNQGVTTSIFGKSGFYLDNIGLGCNEYKNPTTILRIK